MKKIHSYIMFSILLGCQQSPEVVDSQSLGQSTRELAKFEPLDGKVLVFAGQELQAIGGLEEYDDGYIDHFAPPAGWTMYTFLNPGDSSFGYVHKGLDGIWSTDNWGDGPSNMTMQLEDYDFNNMALAIGLGMVNHEHAVAAGERDELVDRLGNFLKGLAPRPVFLRIGYEFDGHGWNHYDREAYLTAYRRIKDRFDQKGIDNVAYIWQSTGWVSTPQLLEEWYPGDDYVDWCGFSFFSRWREQEMIELARKKGKPVMIAEASPTISDHTVKFDGTTKETILSNPKQAREAWEQWFTPFFRIIHENSDVVKAISYINCHWLANDMWKVNPTFRRIDARLQTSEFISEQWKEEMDKETYIHASDDFFNLKK